MNDSLQRLQTDHLDLLQIHWPDRYLPLFGSGIYDPQKEREGDVSYEEQLQGLEKVIKAGKVSPGGARTVWHCIILSWLMLLAPPRLPILVRHAASLQVSQ